MSNRLRDVPMHYFSVVKTGEFEPGHPFYGVPSFEIGQEASRRQLETIKAGLKNENRRLESKFDSLPPLPPRLPPGSRGPIPSGNEVISTFYKLCEEGKVQEIQQLAEGQSIAQDVLQDVIQFGIYHAAEQNQAETMDYLLRIGAKLDSSVLETACEKPSLEVFRVLVAHGWHPNQSMQDSSVALRYCVQNIHLLRYLLDEGADPNLGRYQLLNPGVPTDRRSGEALNAAAGWCEPEVFDLLVERGAKLEYAWPLHCAAINYPFAPGSLVMIEHLLKLGVDINGLDSPQRMSMFADGTPLHSAVRFGGAEAVKLLLELGADPAVKNRLGHTPFDTAMKQQYGEWSYGDPHSQPTWFSELVEKMERKGETKVARLTSLLESTEL